jgi:hypothetical protein
MRVYQEAELLFSTRVQVQFRADEVFELRAASGEVSKRMRFTMRENSYLQNGMPC